ncbi:DUF1844 domain-containing protein [bacterium]|nr:DUF1844 domain-containing protein [bacterium]
MSQGELSRHDHVLAGLVFSLQAAAMQQLGKIQNPATGETAVDLDQARATIDVLEMLKAKCRTDTPEALLRTLDGAVMDIQLNYMDELKKSRRGQAADDAADPAAAAPADGPDAPPVDGAGS